MPQSAACLEMLSAYHDAQGQPLDFEHLYYRGDAFQYRLRIDRHKGDQA